MTRIDEIRQRLDKATPGPWFAGRFSIGAGEDRGDPDAIPVERVALREDADLIANAPADLAYLLGALARRDQRCEDLAPPQPTLPDLAEPSDAEVRAAAEALDGHSWMTDPDEGSLCACGEVLAPSLEYAGDAYRSHIARAALVAARKAARHE